MNVEYEPYGNDVVAKLVAAAERLQHQPRFSLPRHEYSPSWGIYTEPDEVGAKQLRLYKISEREEEPVLSFTSRAIAGKVLNKVMRKHDLYVSYNLLKRMTAGEMQDQFRERLNRKVEKAVRDYLFGQASFFLLGQGTHPDERTLVLVENNRLIGVGSFHNDLVKPNVDDLRSFIKPIAETREAQRIIRQALRSKKKYEILPID